MKRTSLGLSIEDTKEALEIYFKEKGCVNVSTIFLNGLIDLDGSFEQTNKYPMFIIICSENSEIKTSDRASENLILYFRLRAEKNSGIKLIHYILSEDKLYYGLKDMDTPQESWDEIEENVGIVLEDLLLAKKSKEE